MSQAAPALKEVAKEAQAPKAPVLTTLQQYHIQLNNFKQQKEQVKVQFHQLEGAIFACEMLINQHEASLKESVEKLAKDGLKPNENQGEINDGQAKCEKKEPVAQK